MLKDIIEGLKTYTKVYGLITKLSLWKYFIIPMFISITVFFMVFITAYRLSGVTGQWLSKIWFWEFGKNTFTNISTIVSAIAIIAIGLVLYKHIIMALSSPFMSPVSEKIEAYLTGQPPKNITNKNFIEQLLRSIRVSVRNILKELLFTVPLLVLKLIPVVNLLSTLLLLVIQAYYAGFANMDYTLERHFNYRESVHFIKKHKGLAIGNGIGFLGLLCIPIIGVLLVLPLSVTSASVITVNLLYEDDDAIGFNSSKEIDLK